MRIKFMTDDYRWVHGKAPRGRGFWAFEFEGQNFYSEGTLTEAKKACRDEIMMLAPQGYTETVYVNVLP